MIYAVVDTNVIVAALLSTHNDAATVQLVAKIFDGEIIPVFSRDIINEYREVLSRKKFKFDRAFVDYFILAIEKFGILTEPSPTSAVLPDMKDLPFYEAVMGKKCDGAYLVTGNIKHFPKEEFIITPREIMDILDKEGRREAAANRNE